MWRAWDQLIQNRLLPSAYPESQSTLLRRTRCASFIARPTTCRPCIPMTITILTGSFRLTLHILIRRCRTLLTITVPTARSPDAGQRFVCCLNPESHNCRQLRCATVFRACASIVLRPERHAISAPDTPFNQSGPWLANDLVVGLRARGGGGLAGRAAARDSHPLCAAAV